MSFPEDKLFDLMRIVPTEGDNVTIKMVTCHFVKSRDYNILVLHVLNTILAAIVAAREFTKREGDLFDLEVEMKDTKMKNIDIGFMRSLLKIIVDKFPGKLRSCNIYNAPSFFPKIYKLISMIIPKETRQKIHFIK